MHVEPKNVEEVFNLIRETSGIMEQLMVKIMELGNGNMAQHVSASLTTAQQRLVECVDWCAHAKVYANANLPDQQ